MKCRFGEKRLITNRPISVEKRLVAGHWEGDLILFKGTRRVTITTLVERKTRMLILIKNDDNNSKSVMNKIREKLRCLPRGMRRTLTVDQGNEFAFFNALERRLKCRVFYCHAASPWEKGSNENMNGRLRRFLPKNTDIRELTQKQLDQLADRVNNTPRKCLQYRKPNELFSLIFSKKCRTWV